MRATKSAANTGISELHHYINGRVAGFSGERLLDVHLPATGAMCPPRGAGVRGNNARSGAGSEGRAAERSRVSPLRRARVLFRFK